MTSITSLFSIKHPIIQAGMVWVSGAKLAAAVSNNGGLGLIGAGSMSPQLLKAQILKAKKLTKNPFGINIPLLYSKAKEQIDLALENEIKIFFISAGSPKLYTKYLKERGATVVHVVSSPQLAKKCQDSGVDAVVAEGFEAGGHNGKEELTTLVLIPQTVAAVSIPVIAAGGIACGQQMLAAMALGAKAVQIGSLFASSLESSAHQNFKQKIISSDSRDTKLYLKDHIPVRLISNQFTKELQQLENLDKQIKHLGNGRARDGIFLGDLENGELEIGQVCGQINSIKSISDLFKDLLAQYNNAFNNITLNQGDKIKGDKNHFLY